MKKFFNLLLAALLTALPGTVAAQEDVEATVKADIVSHYMWRGVDKGGFSIQPTGKVSWQGLSATLWGSTGIDKDDPQEINVNLNYRNSGFNIGVTDYWTTGIDEENRYVFFNQQKGAHTQEVNIGYTCRWASLQAYTMVGGHDFKPDGSRAYSTYIELAVPFKWAGADWQAKGGITPFKSQGWRTVKQATGLFGLQDYYLDNYTYAEGMSCILASLRVSKTLELSDDLRMPVFAEFNANPYLSRAHLLFGISICPF